MSDTQAEYERALKALEVTNRAYGMINAEFERQNRRLQDHERAITAQAELLEATLDNMLQGLLLLDAEWRVTLFNRRLAELVGYPPEALKVGATARDLVAAAAALGHHGERSVDEVWESWRARLTRRVSSSHLQPLAGGRALSVAYAPMAGGGWVITYEDITERRQAEEALRQQSRHFDAALENMSQGLGMFDADARLIVCNGRYAEMFGLSRDLTQPGTTLVEILKHRIAAGHFAGDPDTFLAERVEAAVINRPTQTDLAMHDGRTLSLVHQPLPEGGWIATFEDISARKAIEQALAEERGRLDAALENMAQGLCMFDAQLRVTAHNRRYLEVLGLSAEIVRPGTPLRTIIAHGVATGRHPGRTLDEIYGEREALFARGEPATLRTPLAGDRTLETTYRPMPGGGWVATYEDITDRHRAEQALAEQRERLDAALNNMAQGLCMFDDQLRIVVHNQRFVEMLGFSPEAVRPGTTLRELFEQTVSIGNLTGAPEALYEDYVRALTERGFLTMRRVLRDRRIIAINHCPMPSGGWVATYEDITEQKRSEDRIAHMARHDALTNLPNRTLFRETMEEAFARSRRGERFTVLCLDLDRFKAVNDTLGHPVGDALLQAVTLRLQDCLSPADTVARLGGDEFAVLVPLVDRPEEAGALARRIIEAVSEPYVIDGHQVVIGTSIGIALAPSDGADPDTLLKNSDMALYRAKGDGRGTFRFFEPDMDARLQERRALELDLRRALHDDQFELYYQPLMDAGSGAVVGFEALLRWNHPSRGLVAPSDFIPLTEEIGLIVPLGEWVIRTACAEAAAWPAGVKVAVNLSPAQFKSRTLVHTVATALASSGLSARRLELEITESVLLADNEATLATLHQLRTLGVRIAMDDFGTGYSSLSYLRSFPFDKIKIDRSFVRELGDRSDCLAIIRAVSGLGSSLGMVTTAEGVETEEQLRQVRAEGCHEVQGYLFSAPRPAGELGRFFAPPGASRAA